MDSLLALVDRRLQEEGQPPPASFAAGLYSRVLASRFASRASSSLLLKLLLLLCLNFYEFCFCVL